MTIIEDKFPGKEHNSYVSFWNRFHLDSRNVLLDLKDMFDRHISSAIDIKEGSSLLEIGCGTGDNLKMLSDKGFKLFGCDISSVAVKKASSISEDIVVQVNLPDCVPFESKAFDIVLFSKTLSTISRKQDLICIIREAKRVLKKGGYVIIIDFCFDKSFLSRYYKVDLNGQSLNYIHPQWSEIPFIHFEKENIESLFSPLILNALIPIDILSCNHRLERGMVCILHNWDGNP